MPYQRGTKTLRMFYEAIKKWSDDHKDDLEQETEISANIASIFTSWLKGGNEEDTRRKRDDNIG